MSSAALRCQFVAPPNFCFLIASLKSQLESIQETLRTELQLTKASTEQKLDSLMYVVVPGSPFSVCLAHVGVNLQVGNAA